MSALPQYQEMKAKVFYIYLIILKLSLHTDICTEAMRVYGAKNIEELAEIEQVILFGN